VGCVESVVESGAGCSARARRRRMPSDRSSTHPWAAPRAGRQARSCRRRRAPRCSRRRRLRKGGGRGKRRAAGGGGLTRGVAAARRVPVESSAVALPRIWGRCGRAALGAKAGAAAPARPRARATGRGAAAPALARVVVVCILEIWLLFETIDWMGGQCAAWALGLGASPIFFFLPQPAKTGSIPRAPQFRSSRVLTELLEFRKLLSARHRSRRAIHLLGASPEPKPRRPAHQAARSATADLLRCSASRTCARR
jgi:hypothetical protein